MLYIYLIAFYIELYILKIIERNFFGFSYSPVAMLGFPFAGVITSIVLFFPCFNFINVNFYVIVIWMFFLLCFFGGGMFAALIFKTHKIRKYNEISLKRFVVKLLNYSCACFLLILAWDLRKTLGGRSIMMIEDQEFAQQGFVGHINAILGLYLTFYIVSLKEKVGVRKSIAFIFIILILIVKIFSTVKGAIILPIMGALIYWSMRGLLVFRKSTLIRIGIVLFGLFVAPFILLQDGDISLEIIILFFMSYFSSGILGLSGYLDEGLPIGMDFTHPFQFFTNFYAKFFEDGVAELVASDYVTITTDKSNYPFISNALTWVGDVYIWSDLGRAVLYFFFCGFLFYYIYILALKSNNIFTILSYCVIAQSLFMSWFGTYFIQVEFYESLFFCCCLNFISNLKCTKNTKI